MSNEKRPLISEDWTVGLETSFPDLFNKSDKRPLYAFLIAQLANILITFAIAYLLFRHVSNTI